MRVQKHMHTFNGPFSRTTQVSQYQKSKTNPAFTEARGSAWQWHQLDHMQLCTSLQTDNHASTPPLSFLQAGCFFCRPTNSVCKNQGQKFVGLKHKSGNRNDQILTFLTDLLGEMQICEIIMPSVLSVARRQSSKRCLRFRSASHRSLPS